jgi:hypothetical protein
MSQTIQVRRGSAAQWTTANPILASGEPGFETDTGLHKIGDGTTHWTGLPYFAQLPATWAANTAYAAGALALDPSGNFMVRKTAGTSRASFDATEQTAWSATQTGGPYGALSATNDWTGTQRFRAHGDGTVPVPMVGQNGGFVLGIDSASPEVISRDFFLGRSERYPSLDNTDDFYGQHNADHTTLAGAVAAGATSLPLAAALTLFTGPDGNRYVNLGDGTTGNLQENVQVTGGSGTATLTVTALQFPHPSGALVTASYDKAHPSSWEFGRVGAAAATNKKWRVTIRGGLSGNAPGFGNLKIERDEAAAQTADYFLIGSRDESIKAVRVQADYAFSVESAPVGWSETNGSTTSGSAVVQLSSVTAVDSMLGAFISGAGIPFGAYIIAVDTANNRVTLSVNATATGSALTITIPKARLLYRTPATDGSPYAPQFALWGGIGSVSKGGALRGKFAVGSGGVGVPQVDLDIYGTDIRLTGGSGFATLDIISNNASGGQVVFQQGGVTRMSFGTGGAIGFYTATPVAKQTVSGSRSANAALADLITKLATVGLITDGTSA